jgi:hypothetical protein
MPMFSIYIFIYNLRTAIQNLTKNNVINTQCVCMVNRTSGVACNSILDLAHMKSEWYKVQNV